MTAYPRLRMRLSLVERAISSAWSTRTRAIAPSDTSALGALMLAAYRGTVDDEGESEADAVAEVERTLAGEYGPFLTDCSFLVEEDGRILGASMVTLWEGGAFLAYTVVHPDVRRRGIATHLIATSGNALRSAGHHELDLFVTEANEPAANLYRRHGFREVDRISVPPHVS